MAAGPALEDPPKLSRAAPSAPPICPPEAVTLLPFASIPLCIAVAGPPHLHYPTTSLNPVCADSFFAQSASTVERLRASFHDAITINIPVDRSFARRFRLRCPSGQK